MPRKAKTKAKKKAATRKAATKARTKKTKAAAKKKAPARRKTAAKKRNTRKAAAQPQEMLLVASKVRAAVKDADCNFAGDAIEGLNNWTHWLIAQATKRAAANGRKTVRAHDFMIM